MKIEKKYLTEMRARRAVVTGSGILDVHNYVFRIYHKTELKKTFHIMQFCLI